MNYRLFAQNAEGRFFLLVFNKRGRQRVTAQVGLAHQHVIKNYQFVNARVDVDKLTYLAYI